MLATAIGNATSTDTQTSQARHGNKQSTIGIHLERMQEETVDALSREIISSSSKYHPAVLKQSESEIPTKPTMRFMLNQYMGPVRSHQFSSLTTRYGMKSFQLTTKLVVQRSSISIAARE